MSANLALVDGVPMVMAAPEGWVVNIDNPTRNEGVINAVWICLGIGNALSLFFLAQNLFIKWYVLRTLQLETVLLVFSWAMGIFVTGWLCDTFRLHTTGVHLWEVTIENFSQFMLIYYITSTVYLCQLSMAKIAIAVFYRRISPARWWQWTINSLITFIVLFMLTSIFVSLFPCQPVSGSWDLALQGTAKCLDRNPIYLATTAIHIALDLVLIILPIPVVVGLQMGAKQKIGLILVFVIGGSTLISSIVRLVVLIPLLKDVDQTWGMAKAILWIVIEVNLLVVCATLPTIKRFVTYMAPKWMGDSFASKGGYPSGKRTGQSGGSLGFRTFGQGSDRRPVDAFGMTIDDENKYDHHTYNHQLKELQHGEPVQVTVEAMRPDLMRRSGSHEKAVRHKARDASSESSFDTSNDGAVRKNSTWNPLPTGGDEQAIVQTRTYSVQRE